MKKTFRSDWWVFAAFALVTVLSNALLVPEGLALHDSDALLQPLWADRLWRGGTWSAFPFQQGYGGTLPALVRSVWALITEPLIALFPSRLPPHVTAHMIFSYMIEPLAIALTAFFALKGTVSRIGAFLAALCCAVGFHEWVYLYGNDYYMALVVMGLLFLKIKTRHENPFATMKAGELLLTGFFCGIALWTFRPTIIFMVALFTPFHLVLPELRRILAARGKIERFIFWTLAAAMVLQLVIWMAGPDIGTIAGRRVRLHAGSNMRIVGALALLLWIKTRLSSLQPRHFVKAALVAAAAVTGFIPELSFMLTRPDASFGNWMTNDFGGALDTLKQLPHSLLELMTGEDHLSLYTGMDRNAPIILLVLSTFALLRGAARDRKLVPPLVIAVLAVIAYLRVYMTGPAEARYLYPLFPVIIFSIGVLWDATTKTRAARILVLLLIALNCGYQINQRRALAAFSQNSGRVHSIMETVSLMQKQDVPVVISDSYWHANAFSFVSRGKPLFASGTAEWGPPEARALALSTDLAGILLTGNTAPTADGIVTLLGKSFALSPLPSTGMFKCYRGKILTKKKQPGTSP